MKKVELDLDRLCQACQHARLALRRYREERREAVRHYVGSHWSPEGKAERVPINLIAQYISIVGRNLIAKNPRVMLATFDRSMKPTVSTMQTWCNQEIERQKLGTQFARIVLDALFSVGIAKVCLATPSDSAMRAFQTQAGQAVLSRVDLDDFVFDMHCRDFMEYGFAGHRFRAPLEVMREDKRIPTKLRGKLVASSDSYHNAQGDERISKLGRSTLAGDSEEFEDFGDFWEVYVPRHGLVYTFADDSLAGAAGSGTYDEPLLTQKWLGPAAGPYHMLGFGIVPGNPMPKGPIQDLVDLHSFINQVYRKLMRQAERQKENTFVRGGASEDGSRIQEANDGDIIKTDSPESIATKTTGGPNQQNFMLFMNALEIFNQQAGNLRMLGGIATESKTATQDQMLNANAGRAMQDMQQTTTDFVATCLRSMCWYWWHDPLKVMRSTFSLPSLPEMQILRKIGPQDRQKGRFDDLDIRVDPYSLLHQTPQMRMGALNQVMTQIVMPMMPMLQQQGISVDLNIFLQKVAAYLDQPDLPEILTVRTPMQTESTQGVQPQGPANSTRTYERVSRPGTTDRGSMQQMMAKTMGVNPGGASETNGQIQPAGAA